MSLALVIRVVVIAVALWIATLVVPGIDVSAGQTSTQVLTLIAVALIFEQGQFAQEGALLTLLLLWRAIRVVHAVLSSIEIEHQLAEESLVEHEKEDLAQLLEQEKDDAKVIAGARLASLPRLAWASSSSSTTELLA